MKKSLSRWLVLGAATALVMALPAAASAAKPSLSCPAGASAFERVDVDRWWDRSVEGFAEMGIAVYEADGVTFSAEYEAFAIAAGFSSAAETEFFVKVVQWAGLDLNQNGYVCMKDLPNTPGIPAFIFNGIDDTASVPG